MKRLLKKLIWIPIVFFLLYSCVYHRKTHMTKDELEWVTNRHEGEIMYFKSQFGDIDTLTIWNISIHNSLVPINWNFLNSRDEEYIAYAEVRYHINNDIGGLIHIKKRFNERTICFSSMLLDRSDGWLHDVPLKTSSLRMDSITMNDIMLFNNIEYKYSKNDSNALRNYAWSKKYGLVQYTFKNGTTFSRIFCPVPK